MILHIIKDYPATIKLFNCEAEVFCVSTSECLADEINLEIEDAKILTFKVYPHETKKLLPFSFDLNFTVQTISQPRFAKAYFLPENNVMLKLFPLSIGETEFSGNQVEVSNSKIKKLSFLNDISGRARVQIFGATESALKLEEEYFVYTNKEQKELSDEAKFLDFFQSIYAGDFKHALGYVSQSLETRLSKDILKEYFGAFNEVKLVNYYSSLAVVLLYDDFAKVYCGNISDGKISDIYEIN